MIKVTVLIENTSETDLIAEHGLSFLIEHKGKNILLDAGSTDAFYDNACKLGVDMNKIDFCVLSHGHYDHSGGFQVIFNNHRGYQVYAQSTAKNKYYSGAGGMHEIGIPEAVLTYEDRFCFVDGFYHLAEGMYLVPHSVKGLEQIGEKARLYQQSGEQILPDNFSHEQSLVFDTDKGFVVFNSCSHGGVENIIHEVKVTCGDKPIYAYVGGLHMKGRKNGEEICAFSDEEVEALCHVIQREQIKYIYTGHCTGLPGLSKMKECLGDVVVGVTTGMRFTI